MTRLWALLVLIAGLSCNPPKPPTPPPSPVQQTKPTGPVQIEWSELCEQNKALIQRMQDAGDDIGEVRVVDHFAIFPTEPAAKSFQKWATDHGAKCDEPDAFEGIFGVHFTMRHDLKIATLERVLKPIYDQVKKLGGACEGFEAPPSSGLRHKQ